MAVTWKKLAFVEDVQAHGAKLDSIQALASAAGYLKNDGAGTFSYDTPTTTTSPDVFAFAADQG